MPHLKRLAFSHDFLNFDDIFKNDRVRGGLQSAKIKKPPGTYMSFEYVLGSNVYGNCNVLSSDGHDVEIRALYAKYRVAF